MLHPSQFDLGQPFDYTGEPLWTVALGSDGTVAPASRGIRLTVPTATNAVTSIQLVHEVDPTGLRVMMCRRVLLDDPSNIDMAMGFWSTDSDPFSGNPANAAMFRKAGLTTKGTVVTNSGSAQETSSIVSFSDETFVDLAVILHGDSFAEFLYTLSDGTWQSVVNDYTGTFSGGMRPSFAVKNVGFDNLYMEVRSLYVHEEA